MKVFGKNPTGKRLERLKQSPQYKNGVFSNIEETPMLLEDVSYLRLMYGFISKPAGVTPSKPLPSVKTNLLQPVSKQPVVTWFGHSSYLIQSRGFNLLVDPVLSGYASPFSFLGKAFEGSDIYTVDDLPTIDLLLITHDHYDHLDFITLLKLKDKVKRVVTSLGVASHLEYWGIPENIITELDWWESVTVDSIQLTATPARHFSGRVFDRAKTLWSSFVLDMHGYRIFIGGDSGYDKQFKTIGQKFQRFDLAILESGQYGEHWPYIHMLPEQSVQAAKDLNTAMLLPVHWAKFALANHLWNDPPKRVLAEALKLEQPVVFPMIGEPYIVGEKKEVKKWWEG